MNDSAEGFDKDVLDSPEKTDILNLNSTIQKLLTNDSTFLDIGAYLGDFTESLLQSNPNLKGYIFEPTSENFKILTEKFKNNSSIEIFNVALDSDAGEKDFFVIEDASQNSLLNFESANSILTKTKVKTETVDAFLSSRNNISNLDFVKIDTQGLDLRILNGAVGTIAKYRPSILTEFIFAPLYKNQGSYFEQFEFLKRMSYCFAGIYNTHYTKGGLLAFADILFIHDLKYTKVIEVLDPSTNYQCTDYFALLEENIKLKLICEERLQLINRVSHEAEERLKIIELLDTELSRIKGLNK
ncbi:MAG: FkbM family methyltransferase [Ignavibacteriales bacterium]|nr:FkbM family methyltransferase [Ignavibacteriales bacterium]